MGSVKEALKQPIRSLKKLFPSRKEFASLQNEVNCLYQLLYDQVHDLEASKELSPNATLESFSKQWSDLPEGFYLLSDPWFRENVASILATQELQMDPAWFQGKRVLDAGCGNGRWAYVFSQLGANLTCVDANQSALHAAEQAIQAFPNQKQFIHTPLEHLDQHIEPGSYDLAFSWGVIHHCKSFNQSLRNVANAVKDGGILYLYLYGEESIAPKKELEQFKLRVKYNYFMNDTERYDFLLEQASGNPTAVHNYHDAYAPLINRRLGFAPVKAVLEEMGFTQVTRTIDHPELFIRAVKGQADYGDVFLPPVKPPYWFNHHRYQKS